MKKQNIALCALFLGLFNTTNDTRGIPSETIKDRLENTTYKNLTTIGFKQYIFKTRRRQQLETLGAQLADTACTRIVEILGPDGKKITTALRSHIPALLRPYAKMDYIKSSYAYAIADFEQQVEKDNKQLGGITAITQLPLERKYDLLSRELTTLNKRYTPIINTIINELKRPTILPYTLSMDTIQAVPVRAIPAQLQ